MTYKGVTGRNYTLIKKIASGGEGDIFSIQESASLLAKIYHPNISSSHEGKILSMVRAGQGHTFRYIAWPRDSLLDQNNQFCGFIMERFSGVKSLAELLPETDLSWKERVEVAYNLCDVVREIHGMNQCIGDMNPSNFGIDPLTRNVFAFDADSFHFHDDHNHFYPCVVGLPEYYAPELQRQLKSGQDMRTIDPSYTFSRETDHFALAVLIFQLLFSGYHPFSGRRLKNYGSSTVVHKQSTNILNKVSPFFNPPVGISRPMDAPPVEIVPKMMQIMFLQAFLAESRPNAAEWQIALLDLRENLTVCRKKSDYHYYYNKLAECPWCAQIIQAKPIVTQHPWNMSVTAGGKTTVHSMASGQNLSIKWHFLSPDGQTDIIWYHAGSYFPGLSVSSGDSYDMKLANVPKALNGWKVYCQYSSGGGSVNTSAASVVVQKKKDIDLIAFLIVVALLISFICVSCYKELFVDNSTKILSSPIKSEATSVSATPIPKASPTPSLTTAQSNAVSSARKYLSYQAYSRKGLIDRLESAGYSRKDATFAVDYVKADWNEQALASAKSYLNALAFSRGGLIHQLEYEGFTHDQAIYGTDRAGVDWNEQAVKEAKDHLSYRAHSRKGLIEMLENVDGFTHEQAIYGTDRSGADWNEQAVIAAESYLRSGSWSRQKLIEQLEYEGFTHEQAVYGERQNDY